MHFDQYFYRCVETINYRKPFKVLRRASQGCGYRIEIPSPPPSTWVKGHLQYLHHLVLPFGKTTRNTSNNGSFFINSLWWLFFCCLRNAIGPDGAKNLGLHVVGRGAGGNFYKMMDTDNPFG